MMKETMTMKALITLMIVAAPAVAYAGADYPPGLFEHSPLCDFSGCPPAYKTPDAQRLPGSKEDEPLDRPNTTAPLPQAEVPAYDPECARMREGIFPSLAAVRAARVRCGE
jgi:hypothetical protein